MFIISIITGLIAAFLSLIISVAFNPQNPGLLMIILLVIIEESIKSWLLFFLAKTNSQLEKRKPLLLNAAGLGLGFGIFEILLIFISEHPFPITVLLLIFIHTLSSLIFSLGIYKYFKFKQKLILWSYFLLAILFHLCYNLIVKNTI